MTSGNFELAEGLDIETIRVSQNAVGGSFDLFGNSSGNTIIGSSVSDYIHGNGGHDYLTGGAGADIFFFDFAPGAANLTTITDFTPGVDQIGINFDHFPAIDVNIDEFFIGDSAQDAEDRLIYNNATGALRYDEDGTGPAAQVHFATLSGNPNLTVWDFFYYP